jgi:type I restriction enzyme R subunit
MPRFDEKMLEDYIVEKFQEQGWKYIPSNELERESFEEPLLISNLINKLKELNKDIGIGEDEIKNVLNELKLRGTGIEGAKQILNLYKTGVPLKFEKDKLVKYVKLFNYVDLDKNEFIISRQVRYYGKEDIRTDIMLYVNGIPLVDIELKNPVSFSESWFDAYKQIKDYEKQVPELYKYVQLGVAAEQIAKYFPIVPWQDEVRYHDWKEEMKDPIDSVIEMLSKEKLLDIIRNYLFFRVEFGNATKVITRYMQYRASEKMVDRVLNNLNGIEEKEKGLIWHWQGSGKTLTMIFAANKLYHLKKLENPTIFFIIDRLDLEDQLYQEFEALDIVEPETIDSINDLKEVLQHDEGKGKRGIMITLIHKFRVEELSDLQNELEKIPVEKGSILTRRNVITFIDESHRTQYGTLAAQMKNILKGSFFFALTGTPISKKGRDTYLEFSYAPEEKYLDKYFVTDSIKDGFTKKIIYQPRLDKEVHLKKDMLETFLEMEFEELDEDIKEKIKDGVRERLNVIKLFLENPQRIKVIAENISDHFQENLDGKFKAMVVTGSRKACVYYKRELDQHLPPEYSEVVMTYARDDPKLMQEYRRELIDKYNGKELDDIKKEVVEKFKEEEYPKILIVTDMLLTGFDAPILQTMYLDKPLKEHRLLQAIARTNRPFKDLKEAGLIIDYVGILKEFKKAFEIYSNEEINGTIYDLESIKKEFNEIINELLSYFDTIPKNKYDRGILLNATDLLTTNEEISKQFLEGYKKLRKIFELLGPDEIKIERFQDYKWLSAIYTYYLRTVLRSQPSYEGLIRKYFDKTIKYVHKTTELEKLENDLPIINFDENYLTLLEEKVKSKEEKAANIVFTLNKFILVDQQNDPVYESVVEKVERLLKLWKEKTKDFENIYQEGIKIFREIENLNQRKRELELNSFEYAVLLTLEKRFGKNESLLKDIGELEDKVIEYFFTNWQHQPTIRKKVEREVRRFVRRYVKKYGLKMEDLDPLYNELMRNVENHGKAS